MARHLLVSNRLPITVAPTTSSHEVRRSIGGLATGLAGAHEEGGEWIGWPGDLSKIAGDQRAVVMDELARLRLVPVELSASEVDRYYEGFSNGVLWPLFHYLLDRVPLDTRDWGHYERVNERFAEAVAARWQPGDLVWVHDYQLALVPRLVRQRLPEARIGFFLHIPFPSAEVFRILPWRKQILEGLLGADLLGFHTRRYARHFTDTVEQLLGLPVEGERVQVGERSCQVRAFPMGVDAGAFERLARDVETEARAVRGAETALLVGIDRLDYTKGIPRRLLAFERLLEAHPELVGRTRLLQVTVPSRERVPAYREYTKTVNELVGRINGRFGTFAVQPVHSLTRALDERDVTTLFRAADVMVVTPLRDGMNLVAKEFAAARWDEDGVLVLSELAGAAEELTDALLVNPYDVAAVAEAMHRALQMPREERRRRMQRLRAQVQAQDVHAWAAQFLDALRA